MEKRKLEELSALELGREVREKRISPTEVLDYFVERIKKRNPSINAFVYLKLDDAYKAARELEEKIEAGEDVGPFAGVPFGLKEFLNSKKGWKNWHGGVRCLEAIDEVSSRFCLSMEKAGGIAIGKTNAPSYGFRGTTDNRMFGPTSTPFNIRYNSGGSSGGSAAAVADGLVPIAEGGDAGGSIRLPACWCNLYGFKASVGTIPSVCRPDAWTATHPLCFAGGLVKTVEDAAVLLDYMAGLNVRDPFSRPKVVNYQAAMNKPITGMKIAFTRNFDLFEVDKEIADHIEKAAKLFEKAGAIVEEVHFNFKHTANELADQWCKGITIDCALDLNHAKEQGIDYLKDHAEDFPEEFIYWKKECDKLGIEDMYKFNLVRTDVLDQFEDVFENYDLIVSPVTCCPPVLNRTDRNTKGPDIVNGKPVETLIGWTQTFLANFVGNPAASVPAGIMKDNLPVGMQIIGRRFMDEHVLQASRAFELLQPWRENYKIALDREID